VNFEEHLANHRNPDGTYDLDAAEEDLRYEIETSPEGLLEFAAKVAKQARDAWQKQETSKLRKQFQHPALSPELELEAKVPLGDSVVVDYGDMNEVRIRTRKDLRTEVHINEIRAFETEITHWNQTLKLLDPDETIADAMSREST
jgi:hypothetical protein